MSKAVAAATLGLVACGSWQASKAFVPAVRGPAVDDVHAALRGAAMAEQTAAAGSAVPMGLVGASSALAVVATGAASSRRNRASARKAVAAVEPPAGESPEVPPPPPPFNPAEQMGVTAPLGFFDPLGFSKVGDEEGFRKLRSAEIKHGRVAMMAAVGAVFQHFVQLPGFEDVPKGLGAVTSGAGTFGFVALVVISGALEVFLWKDQEGKEVGDYGNPLSLGFPLGYNEDMRNRELNNGRAAMFAALGIITAELATGKDAVEQFY